MAALVAAGLVGATVGVVAAQQAQPGDQGHRPIVSQVQDPGQLQPPPPPGSRPGRGGPDGQGDQNGQRPQPTAEQQQEMQQRREQMEQEYINLLAKNLNLDPSTVKAALDQTRQDMQAARITEIQQAVQDGKLTQDQADQMIQRIQNGPAGGPFGFGPGGPGRPGGPPPDGQGGPGGPNGPGR